MKILDSKPSGKYDDEAIQALADSLSKQTHDPDAGLSKVVDENRHEMKVFTYSVGCNNVSVLYEKPEKAPDPDAK